MRARAAITALVTAALLLAATAAGALDAYQWRVVHPDGRVTTGEGKDFRWYPLQPGDHQVELTVYYIHQWPPGLPYVFITTETVHVAGLDLRQVFWDGFETGTTGRWSRTQGGSHGSSKTE